MLNTKNKISGYILIFVTSTFSLMWLLTQDPIAQDLNYHLFTDTRDIWAVPNFWNVVSNIPFIVVGALGLYKIIIARKLQIADDLKIAYILLFSGLSLVAIGSGYYHLRPDNHTLVWDRLPMTIGFMSLFLIVISEYISARFAKTFLIPAILLGISSVVYWHFSEEKGEGDLRFYLLIQFLPILITPIILIFFRSHYSRTNAYWWLLLAYIAAKLFELFDADIFNALGFISGHSLKHFAAALGFYILLVAFEKRRLI